MFEDLQENTVFGGVNDRVCNLFSGKKVLGNSLKGKSKELPSKSLPGLVLSSVSDEPSSFEVQGGWLLSGIIGRVKDTFSGQKDPTSSPKLLTA